HHQGENPQKIPDSLFIASSVSTPARRVVWFWLGMVRQGRTLQVNLFREIFRCPPASHFLVEYGNL
ncbi:MAG: hypothetical protein ABW108_13580, partial [Candidatus Thiodiazotropha sp. 6PLUC10]